MTEGDAGPIREALRAAHLIPPAATGVAPPSCDLYVIATAATACEVVRAFVLTLAWEITNASDWLPR